MSPRVITSFSQAFSRHLSDLIDENPTTVTQAEIAAKLPGSRVQSYVSERLAGKKPVDTDMIAVISELLGASPSWLVGQVLGRMDRGPMLGGGSGIKI